MRVKGNVCWHRLPIHAKRAYLRYRTVMTAVPPRLASACPTLSGLSLSFRPPLRSLLCACPDDRPASSSSLFPAHSYSFSNPWVFLHHESDKFTSQNSWSTSADARLSSF